MFKVISLSFVVGLAISSAISTQGFAVSDPPTQEEIDQAKKQLEDQYLQNIKATLPGNRGYRQLHAEDKKLPEDRLIEDEYFKNKDRHLIQAESKALKNKLWRGTPSDPTIAPSEWSPMQELLSGDMIRYIAEFMSANDFGSWALSDEQVFEELRKKQNFIQELLPALRRKAFRAAQCGDVRTLRTLGKLVPETLEAIGEEGYTPAHFAALSGSSAALEFLAKNAPETFRIQNRNGDTPAHLAAKRADIDTLDIIKKYALETLNEKNKRNGFTPIEFARGHGNLVALAFFKYHTPEIFKKLPLVRKLEEVDPKSESDMFYLAGLEFSEALKYKERPFYKPWRYFSSPNNPAHIAIKYALKGPLKYYERTMLAVLDVLAEQDPEMFIDKDSNGKTPIDLLRESGRIELADKWEQAIPTLMFFKSQKETEKYQIF